MQVVKHHAGSEQLRQLLALHAAAVSIPRRYAAVNRCSARSIRTSSYRRGPFAMYALSEYIGEERVNGALRRLIETHDSAGRSLGDDARPLSRAAGGDAGLAAVPAARPVRGEHVLGARDRASHGGADRRRQPGR